MLHGIFDGNHPAFVRDGGPADFRIFLG
jgi:hypothetical protein